MSVNAGAPVTVAGAREIATRMFANIGVPLSWNRQGRKCPAQGIVIDLEPAAPANVGPKATASSQPFGNGHIRVFFDRVQQRSLGHPELEPTLLAHVLVHEITHVLEGTDEHSSTGVMKAAWDAADYYSMMKTPLRFTDFDVLLIKQGLSRWVRR
jgi:hypothetical protein